MKKIFFKDRGKAIRFFEACDASAKFGKNPLDGTFYVEYR